MTANAAKILIITAAAILGLAAPATTLAGNPVELTNDQLDRVVAGGANVTSIADAQATGVFALSRTTGNALVLTGDSPIPQQPAFATNAGAADGTAVSVGTNLGVSGAAAPSSGTSVTTSGTAQGNMVVNSTFNHTTQGAGGVTFQAGWTFVYGAWVGL